MYHLCTSSSQPSMHNLKNRFCIRIILFSRETILHVLLASRPVVVWHRFPPSNFPFIFCLLGHDHYRCDDSSPPPPASPACFLLLFTSFALRFTLLLCLFLLPLSVFRPAHPVVTAELSDGQEETPSQQQARISASSATRELDELMASLSDFKVQSNVSSEIDG